MTKNEGIKVDEACRKFILVCEKYLSSKIMENYANLES